MLYPNRRDVLIALGALSAGAAIGDRHVTALQFVDHRVDTLNDETRMVPARHVVAVMQILISRTFCCARPSHQLEMKTIVSGRVQKAEAKSGDGHCLLQSKIELVGVPGNRRVKVRHTDSCVIDLQRSKRTGGVRCGECVHRF